MLTLAQSDLGSFQGFMDYARAYRNETIEYIRSQTNNFSSSSYFTICSEREAVIYEKKSEAVTQAQNDNERKKARDDFEQFINETRKGRTTLDLQDFPRFSYQPDVVKSLRRALPDLMLLVFVNVLLFALSFVAFVGYDVRSD
jgi:hypothetical protein